LIQLWIIYDTQPRSFFLGTLSEQSDIVQQLPLKIVELRRDVSAM
jgi:hypothetical protein